LEESDSIFIINQYNNQGLLLTNIRTHGYY